MISSNWHALRTPPKEEGQIEARRLAAAQAFSRTAGRATHTSLSPFGTKLSDGFGQQHLIYDPQKSITGFNAVWDNYSASIVVGICCSIPLDEDLTVSGALS